MDLTLPIEADETGYPTNLEHDQPSDALALLSINQLIHFENIVTAELRMIIFVFIFQPIRQRLPCCKIISTI